MDAEQLKNRHGTCFKKEAYERSLIELINRINLPTEEVRLSQTDKLQISFGLQFLRLELARGLNLKPENISAEGEQKGAED